MRPIEDVLGEAFYLAWDCQGDPAGSGRAWADLPEAGRVRFTALADDMMRRAGSLWAARLEGGEVGRPARQAR